MYIVVLQLRLNILFYKFVVVENLAVVSVRVNEEVKRKMRELPHVNWSDYVRQAIISKIREEEMKEACETMDRLAEKTSGRWSGTEEIRRWRESRYGRGET